MSAFSGHAEELEECPARPEEMSRVLVEPGEEHFEEGASMLNSESWSLGLAKWIAVTRVTNFSTLRSVETWPHSVGERVGDKEVEPGPHITLEDFS